MNSGFLVNYKALIWKELLEAYRTLKIIFCATTLVVIMLMYMPLARILGSPGLTAEQKSMLLSSSCFFIPLMIIPVLGNTIVQRSLYEERRNKTIQVLLAFGIPPSVLWLAKFSVAVALAYASCLIAIAGYGLFARVYSGVSMTMGFDLWVMALFVMPMVAIGVLSLVSLAYWSMKNVMLIGMIFPMLFLLGGWNLSLLCSTKYPAVWISAVAFAAGAVMIALGFLGVRFIPKERISSF